MKQRLIGFVAALAVAVGGALAVSGPAQAATPAVQITKVYYNSPGTDTRSNSSLNAEYVRLTNKRSTTINLKYWTLRDKSNHVYKFSGDFRLAAGASVFIHTGKGTNSATHRYWGSGAYIWNNTGDAAYLRNSAGTSIDTCFWGSSGGYTYC
ncbi:lamin tail domain-containing protein [Micromonospora soli]|uniref:lamin tail domain-containing protein n=1 Tax=Micromonospora sp. NBRC 110009 TaxID=3061627 RepID=UPI0026740C5C|nr:lamin tail domain-containing protein [Micromonospora sp. NBRC 110009]WKU01214.1 lamin tail domain-containing protein [Micromonospora sp. NBRC 110009]